MYLGKTNPTSSRFSATIFHPNGPVVGGHAFRYHGRESAPHANHLSHRSFRAAKASSSVAAGPVMCAEAEKLAEAIAGADASGARLAQARIIAEAEPDLLRVRQAQIMLMNAASSCSAPANASDDQILFALDPLDRRKPKDRGRRFHAGRRQDLPADGRDDY
jgi:hypothetical protein